MKRKIDEGHGLVKDPEADPRCQCGFHGSALARHLAQHTKWVP